MFKALIGALALAFVATAADRAEATTLHFAVSGDYTFNWTMDSQPTPDEVLPNVFILEGVSGIPSGYHLAFFDDGGFAISRPVNDFLISVGDDLLFSGTLSHPVFAPGFFHLTHDYLTNDTSANINLQISATPIPGALVLFASALGGLGLLGWRRKRARSTSSPSGLGARSANALRH